MKKSLKYKKKDKVINELQVDLVNYGLSQSEIFEPRRVPMFPVDLYVNFTETNDKWYSLSMDLRRGFRVAVYCFWQRDYAKALAIIMRQFRWVDE